jgi:Flp pilus assembly protein TadG
MNKLLRFLRSKTAYAFVEFALIAPLLVGMLLPMIDLGMGFYARDQVITAAEAGAQYAFVNGWNSASVQTAISNATYLSGITLYTGYPKQVYGCPTTTGVTIEPSATTSCSSVNGGYAVTAGTYVAVRVSYTYNPILNYQAFGGSQTFTPTSMIRIR